MCTDSRIGAKMIFTYVADKVEIVELFIFCLHKM